MDGRTVNIFKKIYRKITIGEAFNDETIEALDECLAAERGEIEFEEVPYPQYLCLKNEKYPKVPYRIEQSNKFKSDLDRMLSRGVDIKDLEFVVGLLANDVALPKRYRDHKLKGEYEGCHGCNVHPDWLLIYSCNDKKLILRELRTGTHSDLF